MKIRKYIAVLLVMSLLMTLCPAASADSEVLTLDVEADGTNYGLRVRCVGETWYAEAEDLATLGQNKVSINHEANKLSIYKTDANGELICILYSENLDAVCEYGGDYYVPLQKASVETGVCFYDTDPIKATALRTPKQMIEEMEDVFYDQRYQITQILLTDGYGLGATFSHIYAVMPFVGSGSLWGAISGSDQIDRYRNAMTSILENDGEMSTFLNDTIDLTNDVHKNAKILKAVSNLTKKGGKIYEFLLSKGVSKTLLDALAYEKDPYDNLDGFFEGWSDVLNAVNVGHFLEICALYYAAIDTEESILMAMKRVFETSDDSNTRNVVKKLLDVRYGDCALAVADIYAGTLWDITTEYLSDKTEELFFGSYADAAKLIARGIDMATGASDISEAYINFPIYASIQQDLYAYFRQHVYDTQEHTMYDLRAVTIMYLKAAIAAYEFAAFDDSMKDTLDIAAKILNEELAYILSYSESEYAPTYTNQRIIDWLNDAEVAEEPSVGNYPSTQELFDNTCWYMAYGQTLGLSYYGLFRTDGTIRVICVNGLEYPDGSYDYDPSTGRMTVYFNNWADDFQYGDGSFTSLEKYEMQVGEEYLTISPEPDAMRYFEEQPAETEPAETQPSETEPAETEPPESDWDDSSVAELSICHPANRTRYNVGDQLDLTGLMLEVLFDDGSQSLYDTEITASPMTLTEEGTQTITVTFRGATVTYDVSVVEPALYLNKTEDEISLEETPAVDPAVYDLNGMFPFWRIELPEVKVFSAYDLPVTWEVEEAWLFSGDTWMFTDVYNNAYIAARQPGIIVARAKVTCNGQEYYSAPYTVTFRLYEQTNEVRDILYGPSLSNSTSQKLPAGERVEILKIVWDLEAYQKDGVNWLFGLIDDNGSESWIVIS